MKIIVDQEARVMIEQLCDIALKAGGIQNLTGVNHLLKFLEEHKKPTESKTPNEKPT